MSGSVLRNEAVEAIDAAVARLRAQVESLVVAKAILVGLGVPASQPADPAQPSGEVAGARQPPGEPPAREPAPPARRGRGRSRATLELHEQLRKLVGEGVLKAGDLAARTGRPVQSVYQALSDAGISLRVEREQWRACRKVVERGPDPVSPAQGGESPGRGQVAELDFGGVVFVRLDDPLDLAKPPTYLRCTVVSLPDGEGRFAVKGPDGRSMSLEVGDGVAPFRDGRTPTFRLAVVGGGEASRGAGEPDPPAPRVAPVGEGGVLPVEGAGAPRVAPLGTFDFSGESRAASVPELRAEAVRRQRGRSSKAVQFATAFVAGHAHVATVDRMGYGTTVKDTSGHVHRIVRWEVLPAFEDDSHPRSHGLTLRPLLDRAG